MFGGTPSNLAISVMNGCNVEVLAGVNLPMLIKLASVREGQTLEQAVLQAQDAGENMFMSRAGFFPRDVANQKANNRACEVTDQGTDAALADNHLSRDLTIVNRKGCTRARQPNSFNVVTATTRRHGHQGRRNRWRQLDHGDFDSGRGEGFRYPRKPQPDRRPKKFSRACRVVKTNSARKSRWSSSERGRASSRGEAFSMRQTATIFLPSPWRSGDYKVSLSSQTGGRRQNLHILLHLPWRAPAAPVFPETQQTPVFGRFNYPEPFRGWFTKPAVQVGKG